MHKCDNPSCVNPEHLEAGTHALDALDRKQKGRNGRIDGERHGRSKVTDAQAEEIRSIYAAGGRSQTSIAKEYGLSQSQVSKIVLGSCFRGFTKNSTYNN